MTRAELSLARTEVDQARTHVEQFKSISQANEEALTSISLAYDQFKKEAEASVAEKDVSRSLPYLSSLGAENVVEHRLVL